MFAAEFFADDVLHHVAHLDDGDEPEQQLRILAAKLGILSSSRIAGRNPPAAFLTGLFSLVDALLEQPLEELLAQLPLLPEIKVALLENKGVLADYLTVERTFEHGLWQKQTELSSRMVPQNVDLNQVYFEAVEWGQRLLAVQQH